MSVWLNEGFEGEKMDKALWGKLMKEGAKKGVEGPELMKWVKAEYKKRCEMKEALGDAAWQAALLNEDWSDEARKAAALARQRKGGLAKVDAIGGKSKPKAAELDEPVNASGIPATRNPSSLDMGDTFEYEDERGNYWYGRVVQDPEDGDYAAELVSHGSGEVKSNVPLKDDPAYGKTGLNWEKLIKHDEPQDDLVDGDMRESAAIDDAAWRLAHLGEEWSDAARKAAQEARKRKGGIGKASSVLDADIKAGDSLTLTDGTKIKALEDSPAGSQLKNVKMKQPNDRERMQMLVTDSAEIKSHRSGSAAAKAKAAKGKAKFDQAVDSQKAYVQSMKGNSKPRPKVAEDDDAAWRSALLGEEWSDEARAAAAAARKRKGGLSNVDAIGSGSRAKAAAPASGGKKATLRTAGYKGSPLKPDDIDLDEGIAGQKVTKGDAKKLESYGKFFDGETKAALQRFTSGEDLSVGDRKKLIANFQNQYNSANFGGGRTYKNAKPQSATLSKILDKLGTDAHANFKRRFEGQRGADQPPLHES